MNNSRSVFSSLTPCLEAISPAKNKMNSIDNMSRSSSKNGAQAVNHTLLVLTLIFSNLLLKYKNLAALKDLQLPHVNEMTDKME